MTQRTSQQNKALHKYFTLLADELNAAGYDMRRTLKPGVDIPWSPELVKQYLWKSIQEAMLGSDSTRELTTKEIGQVYDVLNKHLGETTGVHVAFPSKEV